MPRRRIGNHILGFMELDSGISRSFVFVFLGRCFCIFFRHRSAMVRRTFPIGLDYWKL